MKKLWLLLLFIFLFLKTEAQQNGWYWGRTSNNNPDLIDIDEGFAGVTDINKNVIFTGYFQFLCPVYFGKDTLTTASGDAYFVKYDSSGNVVWARQSVSPRSGGAVSSGSATDNSGNIYFAGDFDDTVSFGGIELTARGFSMFLVKYDANGNVVWARQAPTGNFQYYDITSDNEGNIYITGAFADSISFGGITLNGKFNFFAVKYDSNGNVVWATSPRYLSYNKFYGTTSITVDKFKSVYITAAFSDTLVVGSDTLIAPFHNGPNLSVIKYDSMGKVVWAQQPYTDEKYYDSITTLATVITDRAGNVYLSGLYHSSITFGTIKINSPKGQNNNLFLVKMNSSGKVLWGKTSKSAIGTYWNSYSMSTDTLSHIYLSCGDYFHGNNDTIQFDATVLTIYNPLNLNDLDGNSSVWKFDTSGNVICSSILPGAGDDWNFITSDPSGKYVYFGGDLAESMRVGPDSLTVTGPPAILELPFVARWKSCANCNLNITYTPPVTLCTGQRDTLSAKGGTSYSWSPSSGLSATTGSSVIANPKVTTTYNVFVTNGDCAASVQIVVTVISSPNPPTFTQRGDTLISSSKYDNQWYFNGHLLNNDTSQNLIIINPGWYYVEVNNEANGCYTFSDSTYTTGINQLSVINNQVSIYPNPTSNQLTVESGQVTVNAITITNLLGQTELKSPLGAYV